ncbi:MAG: hypothetical protein DRR08_06205 [Candidatus Parabeggiatoa sp. nov. 2]|nr:MAG: hypothetical protein B6247_17320 [Beggiatoa sp. 4572_84]RKZ62382.1 MAG: hypothetical protein DRR08_06205 [Gammaproteobacteria bacterium]
MGHKIAYPRLPTTIIYKKPKTGPIWFIIKWIRHFLVALGLLLLAGLLFLYFYGQQMAPSFDEEFLGFLGQFVIKQVLLKKDVASAMLIKTPLEVGVTIEEAIKAMKKHANQLNIKFISSYPLSQEIKATAAKPHRFVEIFEFCDASVAASLLEHNPDFAAYLPCRIALYEDLGGQVWFAILDLELLLHGTQGVEPFVKVQASKIQGGLLKIMGAGAHGVF